MLEGYYFKTFSKSSRSSFPYWYYHWKAFNLLAKELGIWKFKYLFHDIEKPFLRLILPYKKVQKIHRDHNRHHLTYKGNRGFDWEAMFIDWECSRFTKSEAQLDAQNTLYLEVEKHPEFKELLEKNLQPIIDKHIYHIDGKIRVGEPLIVDYISCLSDTPDKNGCIYDRDAVFKSFEDWKNKIKTNENYGELEHGERTIQINWA